MAAEEAGEKSYPKLLQVRRTVYRSGRIYLSHRSQFINSDALCIACKLESPASINCTVHNRQFYSFGKSCLIVGNLQYKMWGFVSL